MAKNINLSLVEDFFESSSPVDYAKRLINVKDPNENKEIVAKIKNRILDLKDNKKKWTKKKKKLKYEWNTKDYWRDFDYNKLFKEYFTICQRPSDMYKKLCKTEGEINEDWVYLIKLVLDKMKKNH